jgi:hypothetical protein
MRHDLFPELDAMLAPAALSTLIGREVAEVRAAPFLTPDSLSGSHFLRVEAIGPVGRWSYVVKRVSPAWDWIMRAVGDTYVRAVLAWEDGLLDQLPAVINPAVVACANDGDGKAILMEDIGADLILSGDFPINFADHALLIDAMAQLHAGAWGRQHAVAPEAGYIDLHHLYRLLSPSVMRREADGPDAIPKLVVEGWSLLEELVAPDVATVVRALLDDPTALVEQLQPFIATIIHADWKLGNLGVQRDTPLGERVILLDWDRVCAAPPAVDLGWYLAVNSARLPQSKEDTIATYRDRLEEHLGVRLDDAWWQPQLDLALLGAFVQLGWPKLLGAAGDDQRIRAREQAELEWWSKRVRTGAARIVGVPA